MPNVTTPVFVSVPVRVMGHVADLVSGIILVRAKHFQRLVLIVSNGVIAYQLVSHGNVQQLSGYASPVMDLHIIEVSPMKLELIQETVFTAWIGKVQSLLRCHRHEYLYHREDTLTKHAFVHITLQLEHSLCHIHT